MRLKLSAMKLARLVLTICVVLGKRYGQGLLGETMISIRSKTQAIISSFLALFLSTGANAEPVGSRTPLDRSFLSAKTHTEWSTGNQLELLIDGTEFYQVRLAQIESAKKSIDITTFLWCADESGYKTAEKLIEAAKRGVQIRVAIDFLNRSKKPEPVYAMMRAAGIQVAKFNPPYWGIEELNNHSLHEKFMIVDGKSVLTGGANICDEYLIGGERKLWHDLEMRIEGPAAAIYQTRYDENWNWLVKKDIEGLTRSAVGAAEINGVPTFVRSKVHVVNEPTETSTARAGDSELLVHYQQNYRRKSDGVESIQVFSHLIDSANEEVVMYLPYYILPPEILAAMNRAVERNVKVKVLTNSPETNDEKLSVYAALNFYRDSLNQGIEIHEYQPRTLHAKAVMIDKKIITLGSHNLTYRSFRKSGEANVITEDPILIEKFVRQTEKDWLESTLLTLDQVAERSNQVKEKTMLLVGRWLRSFM